MNYYFLFPGLSIIIGIIYSVFLFTKVAKEENGTKEMVKISDAIAQGAKAYLNRQYKTISVFASGLAIILFFIFGPWEALAFIIGAGLSALAGYIGMSSSITTNIKTAQGAKKSLDKSFLIAFRGGSITGIMVATLALLSVTGILFYQFKILNLKEISIQPFIALGFGASLISMFARLGGGIYTKGADVGTDMVGKIEKNIPEDDPRNPGVIADLVGDNVGDCAGMAADLFETYVVSVVAAILLGHVLFPGNTLIVFYPIILGGLAIIASVAGSMTVKLGRNKKIMPALYKGLLSAGIASLILFYLASVTLFNSQSEINPLVLTISSVIGVLLTFAMMVISEYYTSKSFSPVKSIAKSSTTGHGTNIIQGLAVSMKSTFAPVLLISLAILITYTIGGLYAIAIATVAMLSLTGIIVSIDSFGPITDNAGGIAEMSHQDEKVRKVTDALDAVGNTTKAVTKAYAIASAGLAALVLFAAYNQELINFNKSVSFDLTNPRVLAGLFIGASLPYLFAALAMEAVGKTGMSIVNEIRRQFKEIKGIMQGKAKPDYAKAVDIATKSAIKEMFLPAIITVSAPILVGFLLGSQALGGFLAGSITTGIFLALSMTTGGAAWDNAKKYIEGGMYGGKGSPAHQAAVTGDTVGDPYKDTAGPAINPMIKVINIVALLIAAYLH